MAISGNETITTILEMKDSQKPPENDGQNIKNACVSSNNNSAEVNLSSKKTPVSTLVKELCTKLEKHPGICIGHLNIRSLLPKVEDMEMLLTSSKMDILTLSETWLDQSIQPHEINIGGYRTIRKDRNRHGGGVMMYIREGIDYKERPDLEHERLEATWIEVSK